MAEGSKVVSRAQILHLGAPSHPVGDSPVTEFFRTGRLDDEKKTPPPPLPAELRKKKKCFNQTLVAK